MELKIRQQQPKCELSSFKWLTNVIKQNGILYFIKNCFEFECLNLNIWKLRQTRKAWTQTHGLVCQSRTATTLFTNLGAGVDWQLPQPMKCPGSLSNAIYSNSIGRRSCQSDTQRHWVSLCCRCAITSQPLVAVNNIPLKTLFTLVW